MKGARAGSPSRPAPLSFLRRDPVLAAAVVVAWAAALVPIWSARLLPLGGWYEQLALAQLWRHLGDPAWAVDRFYARALAPVPGWTQLGLIRAFAQVIPIDSAGRLWLSLYALALPVGAIRLADAFGRSRWLALFVFPLIWNLPLATGRASFAAGLAVLAFALAELERFVRAPARGRAIAVVALSLGLWLTDAAAFGFFVLAAVILCATERPAALVLVVPSVVLAWIGLGSLPAGGAATPSHGTLTRLGEVSTSLVLTFGDRAYELLLLLVGIWLILLLSARTDAADTAARGYRLEALALLALVLALGLPADLHRPLELTGAASRFWPLCALLLALMPHGAVDGLRRLFIAPVLAVAILYPLGLGRAVKPLDKLSVGARRLAARIEPGSSTLTVATTVEEADWSVLGPRVRLLGEVHALPVLAAGGFDPDLPIGFPLRRTAILPTPSDRAGLDPEAIARYDRLLTLGEHFPYERLGPDAQATFPLEAADGEWRLYRRRQ